ncbi:MAG: cbb3-type cytochrome oxidase subunit 3 [Polaromonas sp.]|jgi:cytochrome c oxidase cbb3-type subunit 4
MNLNMDINTLRSLITAFSFVLFVCILVWAYRPSRKTDFDEAAQLPFERLTQDDQEQQP